MISHQLSFGTIRVLEPDIAEVIIDAEVEIDLAMVAEYHECLLTQVAHPMLLLINRRHAYTYTFEAQQHIGALKQVRATAILAYSLSATTAIQDLLNRLRERPTALQVFHDDRDGALNWLRAQRETAC